MNDPRQITATQNPTSTPTLGPGTLVLMGLTMLAIIWFVIQSRVPARGSFDVNRQELLPSGCVYALVAAGVWLATAIDHRYVRFAVRAMIVIAATALYGLLRDVRPWPQSAADFAGLAVVQSTVFFWAGVPPWCTVWSASTDGQSTSNNQFGIADLVIATTVVALLLSLIDRYSPSIEWWSYWVVSAAISIGGASVTTLIAKAMTTNAILPMLLWLSTSVALAVVGTYMIGTLDSVVDRGQPLMLDVQHFVQFYGRIVWGFWLTFAFIACFARLTAADAQSH